MEHWHNPSSIIGRLIEKDKCVNIAESCRRWSCWKCEETKAFVMRRRKKFLHPPFLRQNFTLDSTLALNLSKLCLSISGACVFKCIKCYRWLQFLSFFPPPSYLSLNISCIPGLPQAYCYSSGWPSTSDLPATISQVLEFQVCVPYQVGVLQGIKPKASICQVQSWVPQTLGRQRQEDQEFNANLSYIMSLRLGWGMWTLCPNQNPKNPPTIIPVYSV